MSIAPTGCLCAFWGVIQASQTIPVETQAGRSFRSIREFSMAPNAPQHKVTPIHFRRWIPAGGQLCNLAMGVRANMALAAWPAYLSLPLVPTSSCSTLPPSLVSNIRHWPKHRTRLPVNHCTKLFLRRPRLPCAYSDNIDLVVDWTRHEGPCARSLFMSHLLFVLQRY